MNNTYSKRTVATVLTTGILILIASVYIGGMALGNNLHLKTGSLDAAGYPVSDPLPLVLILLGGVAMQAILPIALVWKNKVIFYIFWATVAIWTILLIVIAATHDFDF
jgi:hypothetical protein